MAKPVSNCYSFFREELPDLNYVYQFSTSHCLGYKVYFNISAYDQWLTEYPYLYVNGYAFGFLCLHFGKSNRRCYDERVATTICKIIEDFITYKGTDCVLLYHCDSSDNRQGSRGRLFYRWHKCYAPASPLIKNDLEVLIPGINRTDYVTYYLGYIAHPANANLDMLHAEFENIAGRFVGVSSIK